jgi:hypothetical protein
MSKPTNSAARNQMSEFERQCYDWGWEAAETEVIKYLKSRVEDLNACGKSDSCSDIAYVVQGIMEDIQDKEHLNDY